MNAPAAAAIGIAAAALFYLLCRWLRATRIRRVRERLRAEALAEARAAIRACHRRDQLGPNLNERHPYPYPSLDRKNDR